MRGGGGKMLEELIADAFRCLASHRPDTVIHGGRVLPAIHVMAMPPAETWCGVTGCVNGAEARAFAERLTDSAALSGVTSGPLLTRHRVTESPGLVTCERCLERQPKGAR